MFVQLYSLHWGILIHPQNGVEEQWWSKNKRKTTFLTNHIQKLNYIVCKKRTSSNFVTNYKRTLKAEIMFQDVLLQNKTIRTYIYKKRQKDCSDVCNKKLYCSFVVLGSLKAFAKILWNNECPWIHYKKMEHARTCDD